MNPDPKHYSMIIQWDNEGKIYVVEVPELPGCMTHRKTYEEFTINIPEGQHLEMYYFTLSYLLYTTTYKKE